MLVVATDDDDVGADSAVEPFEHPAKTAVGTSKRTPTATLSAFCIIPPTDS